jgi:mRNA interferase MazF
VQRGEVWWADFPLPAGRRPVLLLSRNAAYVVRTSITAAVVTRTIRSIPGEVPLGKEDGVPAKCAVNLDEIITIPKSLLVERITALDTVKMMDVSRAIFFALDLGCVL